MKKRIKISSAKAKGRNLQKKVCKSISETIGIEYNQKSDQSLIRSREMGQSGTDVILRGDALKKFPFSVECKSTEHFNINETIKQAKQNVIDGTDWLVVHKRKSIKNPIVIMDYEAFFGLVKNAVCVEIECAVDFDKNIIVGQIPIPTCKNVKCDGGKQ